MDNNNFDRKKLIRAAIEARNNAYAPYSNFKVGAALLGLSGKIYSGCNIENAAYSPSNCAERTAFFKAVSEGEKEFIAMVIVGGKSNYCPPCGVCRQVMLEFCSTEDFIVILAKTEDDYQEIKLKDLMPYAFNNANLI